MLLELLGTIETPVNFSPHYLASYIMPLDGSKRRIRI